MDVWGGRERARGCLNLVISYISQKNLSSAPENGCEHNHLKVGMWTYNEPSFFFCDCACGRKISGQENT